MLAETFGTLLAIYEQADDGKTLIQLLKDDWGMFDNPNMDDARGPSTARRHP